LSGGKKITSARSGAPAAGGGVRQPVHLRGFPFGAAVYV